MAFMLALTMVTPLAAAAVTAEASSADAASVETITITDQADREVEITYPCEKIAVMQHHSLDILPMLGAQEQVVCTEEKWQKNLGDYMTTVFPGIEELPTCGTLAEPNVEAIAALEPDIVICASQCSEEALAKFEELGIPAVVVSLRGEGKQAEAQNPYLADADAAYTEGLEWAIETLGMISGREEKAAELWAFCEESRAYVEEQVGEIADDERVRAFIANESSQTYGNDKYVGCMLLRAGAVNVAAEDIQGYKEYSMEQLYNWDPDVIIVQDRYPEVYEEVTTGEQFAELTAVKEGKVILAPYWTKPFGNPDADSVALGEPWLAHQFYPEKITAEYVQERAAAFYETFYGVEFTDTVE